jgi:hypothetical protein
MLDKMLPKSSNWKKAKKWALATFSPLKAIPGQLTPRTPCPMDNALQDDLPHEQLAPWSLRPIIIF